MLSQPKGKSLGVDAHYLEFLQVRRKMCDKSFKAECEKRWVRCVEELLETNITQEQLLISVSMLIPGPVMIWLHWCHIFD